MAFSYTKLACVLLIALVAAAPAVRSAGCGPITSKLAPCFPYLKGGPAPTPACCAGVRGLAQGATTPAARQAACGCLKSSATSIPGILPGNAAALPGRCGVKVPYPISTKTDCSKVH